MDFSKFKLNVGRVKRRNILIVGLTGSGKSSIIHALRPGEAKVASTMTSVTQNLEAHSDFELSAGGGTKYAVSFIDTVGLGDGVNSVGTILGQILEACKTSLSTIHRVVFCFKMDRLRADLSSDLEVMYQFLRMLGARKEHFAVCVTFCDFAHQRVIDKFKREMQASKKTSIFRDLETIDVSMPDPKRCDSHPAVQAFVKSKIQISCAKLFVKIIDQECEPFSPLKRLQQLPRDKLTKLNAIVDPDPRKYRFFKGTPSAEASVVRTIARLRAASHADGQAR